MQCFLDFLPLQEVVFGELLIGQVLYVPERFAENLLPLRAVVQLIENPSAIVFYYSVAIGDFAVVV